MTFDTSLLRKAALADASGTPRDWTDTVTIAWRENSRLTQGGMGAFFVGLGLAGVAAIVAAPPKDFPFPVALLMILGSVAVGVGMVITGGRCEDARFALLARPREFSLELAPDRLVLQGRNGRWAMSRAGAGRLILHDDPVQRTDRSPSAHLHLEGSTFPRISGTAYARTPDGRGKKVASFVGDWWPDPMRRVHLVKGSEEPWSVDLDPRELLGVLVEAIRGQGGLGTGPVSFHLQDPRISGTGREPADSDTAEALD